MGSPLFEGGKRNLRHSILLFSLVLMLVFTLPACGVEETRSIELTGYVVKAEGPKLLVVADAPKQNGLYDAIWVTTEHGPVPLGQKVKIRSEGGVLTAYPGLGHAKSIATLQTEESAVLKTALESVQDWQIPIVTDVSYSSENKQWVIELKDGMPGSTEEKVIKIDDRTYD